MDALVRGMSAEDIGGDLVDYAFAVEYSGPPVSYEIPQAVPIEIERIPVAAVASPAFLSDPLVLPVVQPLPSPTPLKKNPPRAVESVVLSPTSVIENHIATDAELSGEVGSSGAVGFSSELKEIEGPGNGHIPNRISSESGLSYDYEFQSLESDEDENNDQDEDDDEEDDGVLTNSAGAPGTTFLDSAELRAAPSSGMSSGYQGRDEEYVRMVKKGSCHRCLKGNRFTDKESCLVCDAKYCSGCVLKAMGSMPEGRKCLSCVGSPVDESKRGRLGKASRMLKRLLSSLEVEQAMKAEKYCLTNQLRPEDVCVNGKPLTHEEMMLLLGCPYPPLKLKPGHYWYDKVSGFWGKLGQKPEKIITPNLSIGGSIMRNASNGNTGILINGREITKVELQMLKWAGVQCAGNPHFWVNADGTYQEEGQKNIKGHIWGRARTKLLCSFLSLPVPSKATNTSGEELNIMLNRPVPDYIEQRRAQKLLLIGYFGSGSSTLLKQAKFLYKSAPFTDDELQSVKLMIQTNIYNYLGILLEGREQFEEEYLAEMNEYDSMTPYSIPPRLKLFSDWLLKVIASGNLEAIFPAASREYAPRVEELWNNSAIQATYSRKDELKMLPSVACYFLDRVVEISRMDYEPSKLDILYAEGMTSTYALACTDFFFPQSDSVEGDLSEPETRSRYQLMRLHTKGLGEKMKWLDMFEDVQLVIYCISLSDYDEVYQDENGEAVNKMVASRKLFENVVSHPAFEEMEFLLVLNKFDLLERMVNDSPLTNCDWFGDFDPVISRHHPHKTGQGANNCATLAQTAFHYIAVKFKRLFYSLTGRKLYVTMANCLSSESADASLRYAREILRWKEEMPASYEDVYSTDVYNTDPSSCSH